MTEKLTSPVDAIVELAMTVNENHIDWGMLSVDEENAYRMMAISTLENKDLDDPIIGRSVVTALLVENMVLNIKLLQAIKKGA
jgi:hypothetical protein